MSDPKFEWWDDGGSLLDQIVCSCGWKSATYFDGREYAHAEWRKHVAQDHVNQTQDEIP